MREENRNKAAKALTDEELLRTQQFNRYGRLNLRPDEVEIIRRLR